MDHAEASALLSPYLDNELGVSESMAMERHLDSCAECRSELAQQNALSAQLSAGGLRLRAPAHLAERVESILPHAPKPSPSRAGWNMFGARTGLALAALLASLWGAGFFLNASLHQNRLEDQVIGSHVRSLQLDHLYDVASTDQHTVKPWFNGKLDFSPPITDLAPQGFPLMGGRLDYLNERPVAALIYRREQHPINLFVWPDTGADQGPRKESRSGFHTVQWRRGGMRFWAVSDVAQSELDTFIAAYRAALG